MVRRDVTLLTIVAIAAGLLLAFGTAGRSEATFAAPGEGTATADFHASGILGGVTDGVARRFSECDHT